MTRLLRDCAVAMAMGRSALERHRRELDLDTMIRRLERSTRTCAQRIATAARLRGPPTQSSTPTADACNSAAWEDLIRPGCSHWGPELISHTLDMDSSRCDGTGRLARRARIEVRR
jgi:hypothetical protein